jgi:hypothetical protein
MDVTLRGNIMASRINRAIELLAQDQAIYYVGGHTGHPLTHDRGSRDAHTWADYINIGMEHGSFDMAGLAEYLRGLVVGGPTRWASCCSASSWRAEGIAKCKEIIAVPGIGFAEMGPGDLGLALGYLAVPHDPYPPEIRQARERVFAACRQHRVPFLETCSPENIAAKLDEGVRVVAGIARRQRLSDALTRKGRC